MYWNSLEVTLKRLEDGNFKKVYLFNGDAVNKAKFLEHVLYMVKNNNRLFYKELRAKGMDWSKVDGWLMDYKQVKEDLLHNGLKYEFNISLTIEEEI